MGEMADYYREHELDMQHGGPNPRSMQTFINLIVDGRVVKQARKEMPTRDSVWNTQDGRSLLVRDMEDAHLWNAAAYFKCRGRAPEWQRAFLDELQRRILTPKHFALNLSVDDLDCLVEAFLGGLDEI